MPNTSLEYFKTKNIYLSNPGAIVYGNDLIFTSDIAFKESLILNLFDKNDKLLLAVDMSNYRCEGLITSVTVKNCVKMVKSYSLVCDGVNIFDFYTKKSNRIASWGVDDINCHSSLYDYDFDWQDSKRPGIVNSKAIMYLLHVRGFSMLDTTVKKDHRGTFSALIDKIPYFKELGINRIVLMPAYDFDEIIKYKNDSPATYKELNVVPVEKPEINYWGYSGGRYYRPKSAFAIIDEIYEFKNMVKALHQAGIEIVMEFYFPNTFPKSQIIDVLKFWYFEYQVDGFYLIGEDISIDIICADAYLSECLFIVDAHNKDRFVYSDKKVNKNVMFMNRNFRDCCRRFLKSDTNVLTDFVLQSRFNPSDVDAVNFITTNEGFTLADLVSYDYKHNEDNLENNHDGADINFSWNCGAEGPTRKRNVISLRMRQAKNILTMLLMSQSTPLLLAGDEIFNSQNGNNNAYCQDNNIGWIEWKNTKERKEIFEYVKSLINLRKNHKILHMDNEMRMMDYISCGYPDLSYHADDAWRPRFDNNLRHIAMMLCGEYAKTEKVADDYFYIAYNMHWEEHDFALIKLPKGYKWQVEQFTGTADEKLTIEKKLDEKTDFVSIPLRSAAILKSVKADI